MRRQGRYSLRIRSGTKAPGNNDFGVATLRIPASFQGRTLKLTGFMKTENIQGSFAGLWMRIDGDEETLDFDNMNRLNVRGTTDWKAYTIELSLGPEAKAILLGGLTSGTGTMWLDELELTVDGKPLAQAPVKAIPRYKAAQDTAFRRGSNVALDNLNPAQLEHLAMLGRVWGLVKYYHPAVARGDYNWDAELLRVLPKVLGSSSSQARNELLRTWVADLGPVPPCASCREPGGDTIRLKPDVAWLRDEKQLGSALSQQLDYLRLNRNQGPHYYVRAAPSGNVVFRHEQAYARPVTPDAGLRLLALFRYWNMIAYFFPYRYAIGEDWQQVLPEFIPKVIAARTDEQYRLVMLALIARLHDSHASIFDNDKVLAAYRGSYYAPVQVRFVEKQAVITGYYQPALGLATGLQKGDVVLQVDDVPVAELVKARQPFTPASNEPAQLRNIAFDLLRGSTKQVKLLVRRDGRDFPVVVPRVAPGSGLNLALNFGTPDPKAPAWRLLPNKVGLLTLGTLYRGQLPAIMQAAKKTKGLVIDLRNYPADFVVYQLAQYLMPQQTAFVQFSGPRLTYPGLFPTAPPETIAASQEVPYAGKVVILVNELTQSQAELTAMALRVVPGAQVVGSTTAGADGNVSSIVLPGDIKTMITSLGVYYPDGRETQRVGIVPDVVVEPTIQGIRDGRDEVLERAVKLLKAP